MLASDLDWSKCLEHNINDFECATLDIPLDHQRFQSAGKENYDGDWIKMPLVKLVSRDPEKRLGSILVNPGGPGGSGIDFIVNTGSSLYNDAVREHFDLIGFDPRGIGRTQPLRCFREILDYLNIIRLPKFPLFETDYENQFFVLKSFSESCNQNADEILNHMSTADVAHDLEHVRVALNENSLNFVGYSYGSFLGITYANLYPKKVGRMILDGVIDPEAWIGGQEEGGEKYPLSLRLKTDEGSSDTLAQFFRECDVAGKELCQFSGDSRSSFAEIVNAIKSDDLEGDLKAFISYDEFINQVLSYLYDPASWEFFGEFLAFHHDSVVVSGAENGSNNNKQADSHFRSEANFLFPQTIEGTPGVICSDTDIPLTQNRWQTIMREAELKTGYFAKIWAWKEAVCINWPVIKKTRFRGPFNAQTQNGILIMNTRYDPATPLSGALSVRNNHSNSKMVLVEGSGHTTLFSSSCATDIASTYLISGILPDQDLVCDQDLPPFVKESIANSQILHRKVSRRRAMYFIQ